MEVEKRIRIASPPVEAGDIERVMDVARSGWLTGGEWVERCEALAAEIHGVRHAVMISSATAGLHIALLERTELPDSIRVPAFTWCATANVVEVCGKRAQFVDVDERTYNADRKECDIPVDLFGRRCVPVGGIVEDAACGFGLGALGRQVPAVVSFHPRKQLSCGESGVMLTNLSDLDAKYRQLRDHGGGVVAGLNYRMSEVQSALLYGQMERWRAIRDERKKVVEFYCDKLRHVSWLVLPKVPERPSEHTWQAFVCRVVDRDRDDVIAKLDALGIETRKGTQCVPLLPYYREKYGYKEGDFPVAEQLERDTLALPLHTHLTGLGLDRIVRAIESV